jgi:acyl-CoA thioester hydrolase
MNEHTSEFCVRDYELDLQGIVNNANYQHYLEHARHEYLCAMNIDFAKLHEEGKDLIVTRVEIDYKFPLKSRDRFMVISSMHKEGNLRIVFDQRIVRIPDEKLIVKGKVIGVCLLHGRPVIPENVIDMPAL